MLENQLTNSEGRNDVEFDKALILMGIREEELTMMPVVTFVGESKAAKSTLVAKSANVGYQEGMMILTGGKGSTTSSPTNIIIDPNAHGVDICICIKNEDRVRNALLMNFKDSMIKGLKSILSSLPKDEAAVNQFLDKAVEDRIADEDAKFRVSKLLRGEYADIYSDLMRQLLELLIKHADNTFRDTYFETKKHSEKDANMMLSILVDQVLALADNVDGVEESLSVEEAKNSHEKIIPKMISSIIDEGNSFLLNSGFVSSKEKGPYVGESIYTVNSGVFWYKKGLSGTEFEDTIRKVTNSKDCLEQSVACFIETMTIRVPGKGLSVDMSREISSLPTIGDRAYIICDVIGLSNDGLENVGMLARQAMLETLKYDVVVYVGKITTIEAVHLSYLKAILQTIRPAKLIAALTFCDKDDIFDSDEEIGQEAIYDMIHGHQHEMLSYIKGLGISDAPVIMPTERDIICFSNIVPKRLGEAAEYIFKSDKPFDMLRTAIANGYNQVRRRIHILGISEQSVFMKPEFVVEDVIGDTIAKLTDVINKELNDLKARSNNIHHWTVDAILWRLLVGGEHISAAYKWDNVHIQVYTNIRKILLESYGAIKFDGTLNIENESDANRIRREFTANLLTEISMASVRLLLNDSRNSSEKSEFYPQIRALALKSKYNKWLIFEDLRHILLNAVTTQDVYLKNLLNDSFKNACQTTFKRILL